MIRRFAVVALAAGGICLAMPAGAEEVGIGVGRAQQQPRCGPALPFHVNGAAKQPGCRP